MFLLTFALLAAKLRLRDLARGARRKRIAAFLFMIFQAFIASNCYQTEYRYVDRTKEVKPKYSPKRLTLDLINEFHLDSRDLMKLKYYLENALLLQDLSHKASGHVTSDRTLELTRVTDQEEIVFEHMTVGYPVSVWEDRQYVIRQVYKIAVQFDQADKGYLVFVPNIFGDYVVEVSGWNRKVWYQDKPFSRLRGAIESYLLVDSHLLDEIKYSRRIVSGMEPRSN